MKSIPHGSPDLVCPLHRQRMSKVCHTCPMWMSIKGKHPQTGEDVDDWNCALVWGPLLAVQQAKETYAVSRELNIMRNENETHHQEQRTMAAIAVQRSSDSVRATIAEFANVQPRPLEIGHEAVEALPKPS